MNKYSPLYVQTLEQVVGIIKNGELKPGDKLPTEKELSQKLGVSRSCLREVLKSMAMAGLIEAVQGRGTFVKKNIDENLCTLPGISLPHTSFASLKDVMEVRMILEIEASGLAAQRASETDLEYFKTTVDLLRNSRTQDGGPLQSGSWFHYSIFKLTNNELLMRLGLIVGEYAEKYRSFPVYESKAEEFATHEAIFNAIINRDADGARQAMKKHLSESELEMSDHFSKE